jgi:hypothetical protein
VPILKVTVSVMLPSAVAWLSKYSMFFEAVDLLFQRRGHRLGDHARVGAGVLGAHHDLRRRDLGYSEIGSWIASRPTRKMKIDSTVAKRGRSMKSARCPWAAPQPLAAGAAPAGGAIGMPCRPPSAPAA